MIALKTFLGLHPGRWRSMSSELFFAGSSTVLGGAVVLAVNRFGGLLLDSPAQFAQMGLWVIWGWLFLGTAIWFAGGLVTERVGSNADQPSLLSTLASVGFAHRPVLVLGLVMFTTTGLLQVNGPGAVVAVFAFAFWMPLLLTLSVQHSRYIPPQAALLTVIFPYLIWLATVGRHVISRVSHLL